MKTKSYARFLNRIAHFEADIELADVLAIANHNGVLHSAGSRYLFEHVDPARHARLASRAKTSHSRKLAIRHLKATLCASFLKDVYEDLTSYLSEVLTAAARNGLDPNRLIGDHKTQFEANDILRAKTWNAVVALVAKSVFRQLENKRSTKELLEKMNSKLDLGVAPTRISQALPYLEMRHLLVHADGVADDIFCNSFPAIGATSGHKLVLDYPVLLVARKKITALVEEFDRKVVSKGIVGPSDLTV